MNASNDLILNPGEKIALFNRAYKKHREHPETNLASYRAELRLALGKELLSKKRIYLDTNHWVRLRDVHLRRSQNDMYLNLYKCLDLLVTEGKAVCPASNPCIIELFNQANRTTRLATAQVIDRFSLRSVIQNPIELMKLEVSDFCLNTIASLRDTTTIPLKQRVWTRPIYFYGDLDLPAEAQPGENALAVQKAQEDLAWSYSLEDFVFSLGEEHQIPHTDGVYAMQRLNAGKFTQSSSFDEFHKVFLQEVAGSLGALKDMIEQIWAELSRSAAGERPVPGDEPVSRMIYDSFMLKKITTELPSLGMYAGMHAAIRCDPARKYKKGDFEDLNHATVALPYFDYFLTEKSLAHLIKTRPLQYDRLYACAVLSSADELIDQLKGL